MFVVVVVVIVPTSTKNIINEITYLLLQKRLELFSLNKYIFVVLSTISTATKFDVLRHKLHFIQFQFQFIYSFFSIQSYKKIALSLYNKCYDEHFYLFPKWCLTKKRTNYWQTDGRRTEITDVMALSRVTHKQNKCGLWSLLLLLGGGARLEIKRTLRVVVVVVVIVVVVQK